MNKKYLFENDSLADSSASEEFGGGEEKNGELVGKAIPNLPLYLDSYSLDGSSKDYQGSLDINFESEESSEENDNQNSNEIEHGDSWDCKHRYTTKTEENQEKIDGLECASSPYNSMQVKYVESTQSGSGASNTTARSLSNDNNEAQIRRKANEYPNKHSLICDSYMASEMKDKAKKWGTISTFSFTKTPSKLSQVDFIKKNKVEIVPIRVPRGTPYCNTLMNKGKLFQCKSYNKHVEMITTDSSVLPIDEYQENIHVQNVYPTPKRCLSERENISLHSSKVDLEALLEQQKQSLVQAVEEIIQKNSKGNFCEADKQTMHKSEANQSEGLIGDIPSKQSKKHYRHVSTKLTSLPPLPQTTNLGPNYESPKYKLQLAKHNRQKAYSQALRASSKPKRLERGKLPPLAPGLLNRNNLSTCYSYSETFTPSNEGDHCISTSLLATDSQPALAFEKEKSLTEERTPQDLPGRLIQAQGIERRHANKLTDNKESKYPMKIPYQSRNLMTTAEVKQKNSRELMLDYARSLKQSSKKQVEQQNNQNEFDRKSPKKPSKENTFMVFDDELLTLLKLHEEEKQKISQKPYIGVSPKLTSST